MSAKITFKSQNQPKLFEYFSSIEEQIPNDARMRMFNSILDEIDIREIMSSYKGGGTSAYHPRNLLKAIIFCYSLDVYSCRNIENMFRYDMRVKWLGGGYQPSYRTINRFQNERLGKMAPDIFHQIIVMLSEKGYIDIATIYIDGTTMESRASRYSIVWRKTINHYAKSNTESIAGLIDQISQEIGFETATIEKSENEAISDASIQELKEQMSKISGNPANKPVQKEITEVQRRLSKAESYNDTLSQMGERNSMSKTDHDATGMHPKEDTSHKGNCKAMHNLQIATNSQFVLGFGLYSSTSDMRTLPSFAQALASRFNIADKGTIKRIVADAGYGSYDNILALSKMKVTGYLKYSGYQQPTSNKFSIDAFPYDADTNSYKCPAGNILSHTASREGKSPQGNTITIDTYECNQCRDCPLKGQCIKSEDKSKRVSEVSREWRQMKPNLKELLDSNSGQDYLHRRSIEPEPVFGQMKQNKHYSRFRHFSKSRIVVDLAIFFTAFSIAKWLRTLFFVSKRAFEIQFSLQYSLINAFFNKSSKLAA